MSGPGPPAGTGTAQPARDLVRLVDEVADTGGTVAAAAGATVGQAGGRPALCPEAIRGQLDRIHR